VGFTVSTAALLLAMGCAHVERAPEAEIPETLCETGLYADCGLLTIAGETRPFTPQYPLWTDGATKQRWIAMPAGSTIDGSDPAAWQLPIGTRLWKQFSFGRRIETRYMVRGTAGWRYATYVWSADGRTAALAPATGTRVGAHRVPSDGDCRACHANGPTPVLGFSALQLSPDRDPAALHGEHPAPGSLALIELVASGALVDYRGPLVPRIAARTSIERTALGYLHGNCGNCHRTGSPIASLGMILADGTIATTIGRPSQFAIAGSPLRIAPGDPDHSVLLARMRSRDPALQMPPLGTDVVDDDAITLLSSWITQLSNHQGD
jgi:hypothetical protein